MLMAVMYGMYVAPDGRAGGLPGVLLSCSRVLLRLKRPPYPKYPTLGACRCRATKPYRRGHVHSPPTPWVLGVAWPCAWALCGHSEQVSTVFLAPHMSIHRHMDRFSQKSGYFWSNFEKIISKSASKWDFTPQKNIFGWFEMKKFSSIPPTYGPLFASWAREGV